MRRELSVENANLFFFLVDECISIPENLTLYETAWDHYSLEPARTMELDGML